MTPQTLLHRQVHPSWVQEGRVTSQAFLPTPKDGGILSVYDGDQISAEEAWVHFTTELRFRSAGVLAVSVRECDEVRLKVRADREPFQEHVSIDFDGKTKREIKAVAEDLRDRATARGWQFRAEGGA